MSRRDGLCFRFSGGIIALVSAGVRRETRFKVPTLGWPELVGLFLLVFILFGAKKLPEIGRSIGRGMREFKRGISGVSDEVQKAVDEESHDDQKAG